MVGVGFDSTFTGAVVFILFVSILGLIFAVAVS
jgi:hypothetical protein